MVNASIIGALQYPSRVIWKNNDGGLSKQMNGIKT